jgi:hypothetical protein
VILRSETTARFGLAKDYAMAAHSTALSKLEKRGRASASADTSPNRLLYTRKQTQQLLGDVSIATLIRLERAGILRPRRLLSFGVQF